MEILSTNQLAAIYGAGNDEEAYNAGIYASVGAISSAIGGAIAGPIGAAIGAGLGAVSSHLLANHKEDVVHAIGQASEFVADHYAQGHKDAHFTGMPMAYQR